jgi:hypothetical protein
MRLRMTSQYTHRVSWFSSSRKVGDDDDSEAFVSYQAKRSEKNIVVRTLMIKLFFFFFLVCNKEQWEHKAPANFCFP